MSRVRFKQLVKIHSLCYIHNLTIVATEVTDVLKTRHVAHTTTYVGKQQILVHPGLGIRQLLLHSIDQIFRWFGLA